jgi:hypothetical protein
VAGKEIVAPPAAERVQVLSLMDALTKRVAEAKAEAPADETRPPKQVASSGRGEAAKKQKSS